MTQEAFDFVELTPLHEVPRGSVIDIEHLGLKYTDSEEVIDVLKFHKIDGMYSYCTDFNGKVIHLKCTTPVIVI